jgi:hypothetical protein
VQTKSATEVAVNSQAAGVRLLILLLVYVTAIWRLGRFYFRP